MKDLKQFFSFFFHMRNRHNFFTFLLNLIKSFSLNIHLLECWYLGFIYGLRIRHIHHKHAHNFKSAFHYKLVLFQQSETLKWSSYIHILIMNTSFYRSIRHSFFYGNKMICYERKNSNVSFFRGRKLESYL